MKNDTIKCDLLNLDLVTAGFTHNEAILLSPLFRKLFHVRFIRICTELLELNSMLSPKTIVVCNGSSDFMQLDAVCIAASEKGSFVKACIFAGEIRSASLALARKSNIPVILAELQDEEELCECSKAVSDGRHYWSKSLSSYKMPQWESFDEYFRVLSIKERIACISMLQGYKHDIIASVLGVKKTTADTYCSRVFEKLGVQSLAQLFQYFAFRNL